MSNLATPVAHAKVPALSVVVASVNGWKVLEQTLKALDAQPERDWMEIIVVEAKGGATRAQVEAHQPPVTLIPVDERLPIPRLRYLGVRQSRGKVVAIVEDHGAVASDWASTLLELHQGPWGAVGGRVENGQSGLVNWAVFFCEYASYMGPVPEGEASDLPGNNIAYKRPHLMKHAHVLDDGKWESWVNDRLRADGIPLASTNRAVVRHIKPFRPGYFLRQRFHFARSYAGMRRVDQTPTRRLIYGVGSLALPAFLLARVTRTTLSKGRYLGRFAACFPLVALFLTVGAVGEMAGYFFGAGTSLEQVE